MTTSPQEPDAAALPVVVIWSRAGQPVDDSLESSVAPAVGESPIVFLAGDVAQDAGRCYRDDSKVLERIASDFPGRPLLLLRAGLRLPEHFAVVLQRAAATVDEAAAIAFPGNHDARVDPLAGFETSSERAGGVARMVDWSSDGLAVEIESPPPDCILLAPRLARGRPASLDVARALLLDSGYVTDPHPRPAAAADPGEILPAPPHGHLRLRLRRIADTADEPLPAADGRPVTLHITHAWGGGVWQWIEDLIAGDPDHVHLVLIAVSDSSGRNCGIRLKLCAIGPDSGIVRELDLRPSIASAVIEHAGYRELLAGLIERFGVSRIVVSSLIGHSLDCLETGLPTLVMLHDFFPLWPLLDRDPLPLLADAGGIADRARAAALEAFDSEMRFHPNDPEFWNRIAAAWCERVRAGAVRLAAPTRHVVERIRALSGDDELQVACVAHGFRPFAESDLEATSAAPPDGPLHLVIPGRLTEGKGLALLQRALPELAGRVRLTALGCGRSGLKLMGVGGIDLVPEYRRDELPGLVAALAPHGALLLSTVPETWSYTLSEMRALGLAPIASRVGAFAERIRDGHDGVLFEPTAEALVAAIEAWRERPQALAELAARAPAERTLAQMADDIDAVLGGEAPEPVLRPFRVASADQADGSWKAAQMADALARAEAAETRRAELTAELERRSRWAETMERQFRERSAWADQLEAERRRQESRLVEQVELLEQRDREFRERSAWAEQLEAERQRQQRSLAEQAALLEQRDREFRERAAWAEQLEAERQRQEQNLAEQAAVLEQQDRQYHEIAERYGELIDDYDRRLRELDTVGTALSRVTDHHARLAVRARQTLEQLDLLTGRFDDLQRQHDRLMREHDRLQQLHEELGRNYAELESSHQMLAGRHEALQAEYDGMVSSRSWRYTRPFRFVRRVATRRRLRQLINPIQWFRMAGVFLHHLRSRGLRQTLELLQTPAEHDAPPPASEPVVANMPREIAPQPEFEPAGEPVVSIVIPVHNQLKFTAACLQSLASVRTGISFEVIVVDDASTDRTWKWLQRCSTIRALRNRKNLGFIGTCNRGARAARGRYLVFLNNDTQVTDGWLDALIGTFAAHPDAGIVGARLVFADGRLQEAGGIIFDDASGWNYGRGDDPDRPEFSFVSETDYVSGACLAIERRLFESLDGFDRHFAPAYYEDTDLCFRVRRQGLRVLYQPASRVIHFEGMTSGTDESTGAKRYQAVNRERFLERWRETLAAHPKNPNEFDARLARGFRYRRQARRALVIDAVTPAPDQDSGSVRMFAMLELLSDIGFQTAFMPQNLHWTGAHSEALQQAGIEVLTAPWVKRAEDWLREHGAELDLVVVSRHYVLSPLVRMIRSLCPNARLVFDTVDLHFLREQREAELRQSQTAAREAEKTRRDELALIRASDATLVVSEFERDLLARLAPDARVFVVSNIHSVHGPGKAFDQRRDLVFVGGFQHPPNLDAAEWLIDEILPEVRRELPDVALHIIGSKMPESLRARRGDGLRIHGFVADLEPYLTGCRVSVAPLRYGAGVKGKVNQAMSHGLPVVATTCAAEGMYVEQGRDVLMADDTEAFAQRIVEVYRDRELWQRLAENGRANVDRHFSVAAARAALGEVLEHLELPLESGPERAVGAGQGPSGIP